jgi:prepilin-type N-terminal cleavage/methylation domain-containing protein
VHPDRLATLVRIGGSECPESVIINRVGSRAAMKNRRGFTIIEITVAIVVLTVGLLGLVTTAALVTRMMGRGQRTAMAAAFAQSRVERLRSSACIPAQRVQGSDTLFRGSTWVAINRWAFSANPSSPTTFRVLVVTLSKTVKSAVRVDSSESSIPCR